jgi:hypothetical protein
MGTIEQQRKLIRELQADLDSLRVGIKALQHDVESTRRERDALIEWVHEHHLEWLYLTPRGEVKLLRGKR